LYELHLGSELIDPTSNFFAPGHRIRVHIASSDFPGHDVNPGNGVDPTTVGVPIIARNTIYHDAKHPSHIVLPVIP
jgi:predicted acyl esterase